MKTRSVQLWCCLTSASLFSTAAVAQSVQRGAQVTPAAQHDVSLPLREMALTAPKPIPGQVEMREQIGPKHIFSLTPGADPVGQDSFKSELSTTQGLSFDGVNGNQGGAIPPDTNGSVGATQFVEITNFDYAVYNKTTGAQILGPTRINVIWSGFGGQCQLYNGGDPIVLWDKAAQRWLVEQLEYTTTNQVCVAVSTSEDATGTYNRYVFNFGGNLPDYPKLSVWPDAYYLAVNSYGQGFGEPCALDRTAMLAGTTATMECFSPNSANFSFLPSDLDGATPPPAGAPNHYVELGNTTSTLNEYDFHVDFANPNNATFTGPQVITVPVYKQLCGGGNGACIPQPSPGTLVDALGDRLMFRLAYRNFGDHEAMVVTHSVAPAKGSSAVSAVRWYELRATPVGATFAAHQSGTLQSKTDNLWMGSIAMDKAGDIALGFSRDNTTTLKPSIVYTGRVPTDPLGMMETPVLAVKGTGVQTGSNRWGDYSTMSLDPSDDCTFWYTQEYGKSNGTNWATHMVSFKFTTCQ
jgi:hypothetical protein